MIMGIDQSLNNFAICIIKNNNVVDDIFRAKCDGAMRLELIKEFLHSVLYSYLPNIIVIEGYSFGSRGAAVFNIGELGGVMRVELYEYKLNNNDCVILVVPPTVLKKFVCGKGNVNKNIVLQQVLKKYGREYNNDNSADAFVLVKIGEEYSKLKGEIVVSKKIDELFKSIRVGI